jgi:hypothetical protein
MFDPDANMPRPNRSLIYFGACIIAGLRLARELQVNVRVIPTSRAIEESVDLAHEVFNSDHFKAFHQRSLLISQRKWHSAADIRVSRCSQTLLLKRRSERSPGEL